MVIQTHILPCSSPLQRFSWFTEKTNQVASESLIYTLLLYIHSLPLIIQEFLALVYEVILSSASEEENQLNPGNTKSSKSAQNYKFKHSKLDLAFSG